MSLYVGNRKAFRAEVKVERLGRIEHSDAKKRPNFNPMSDRLTVPDPRAQITLQRNGIGDAMYTSRILRDEGEDRESISDRLSRDSVLEHHSGIQRRIPRLPPANYRS